MAADDDEHDTVPEMRLRSPRRSGRPVRKATPTPEPPARLTSPGGRGDGGSASVRGSSPGSPRRSARRSRSRSSTAPVRGASDGQEREQNGGDDDDDDDDDGAGKGRRRKSADSSSGSDGDGDEDGAKTDGEADGDDDKDADAVTERNLESKFSGDDNIDQFGAAKEGKELRVRSFVLPDRHPTRLYALTLDVARAVGYSESFRFMKLNPHVPRINLSLKERLLLIDMELIHKILKHRDVAVLPVALAYLLFGEKMVRPEGHISDDEAATGKSGDASLAYGNMDGFPVGGGRRNGQSGSIGGSQVAVDHYKRMNGALIAGLRDAPEPETYGADWIYKCALSAAEYNAHLRLQRAERLWGWSSVQDDGGNESDDEDIGSDLMSESDYGESRSRKTRRSSKVAQVSVKRNGFFDVHTGVNQLPRLTQPQQITVQTTGISLDNLLRPPPESVLKEQRKILIAPSDPFPACTVVPTGNSQKQHENNVADYPLALMPGQYQHAFSVEPTRFNRDQDLSLLNKPPPKNVGVAANGLMEPPVPYMYAGNNVQQNYQFQVPQQQQNMYSSNGRYAPPQYNRPGPSSSGSARDASTPRSFHCGFITMVTGQPCRQKVLVLGERCMHHRNATAERPYLSASSSRESLSSQASSSVMTAEQAANAARRQSLRDDPTARCMACEKRIPALRLQSKGLLTMSELLAARVVECTTCGDYYHTQCLEHCTPVLEMKIRAYDWECENCKNCTVCERAHNEKELIFCDDCDRAYHIKCLEPPLPAVPEGSWLCGSCAECSSCHKKASPPYHNDVRFKHITAPRADIATSTATTKNEAAMDTEEGAESMKVASTKPSQNTYLTTLCEECCTEFDAGNYCPICLCAHLYSAGSDSPRRRGMAGRSLVTCAQCARKVHSPGCDPESFGADGSGASKFTDGGQPYHCALCRPEQEKNVKRSSSGPAANDRSRASTPLAMPVAMGKTAGGDFDASDIEYDSEDEAEFQRRYTIKNRPKKRGRPPKKATTLQRLALQEQRDVRSDKKPRSWRPFKLREVALYKEQRVAIPILRHLQQ